MIYCVVPKELEGELYEQMVRYYNDNPGVKVIVDRREGSDRRGRAKRSGGERDRRRRRATGSFPSIEPGE